jgi:hypothetical protein
MVRVARVGRPRNRFSTTQRLLRTAGVGLNEIGPELA